MRFLITPSARFSEPQLDIVSRKLKRDSAFTFAVEYLPGQFDQRADSAEQCIAILSPVQSQSAKAQRYISFTEI